VNLVADIAAPETPAPSLSFSMRMFAEEASRPSMATALRRIADAVDRGDSWVDAVRSAGPRLPKFLRGVFIAAERTGFIEQVIGDYLSGSRRARRARRRVLWALVYPAVLLFLIANMTLGIFTLVVPSFTTLFEDFGIELPVATRLLLTISDVALASWPWLGGLQLVGIVLLIAALMSMRIPFLAPAVRTAQAIPIIGTASQLAAASEFCLLLAMLVRARVPLPEALRLTSGGLRDANLHAGAAWLARDVERGDNAAYAASVLPNFSPRLVQVLRHTSSERSFAQVLKSHGELFALQAEAHAGIAVMWAQPLLLVFVGLVGGFVVIGLFMPIIQLLNSLT
jgi:type II secretory pathway component PulF